MHFGRKHHKYVVIFALLTAIFILTWAFGNHNKNERERLYQEALALYKDKHYLEAADQFNMLGLYEDSFTYLLKSRNFIKYEEALNFYENKQFNEARERFIALGDFENSAEMAQKSSYAYAMEMYHSGYLEEAFSIFQELGDYEDSYLLLANITLELKSKMERRLYNTALQYYQLENYTLALEEFSKIEDYADSAELKIKCEEALLRRKLGHTISAGISLSLGVTTDGKIVCAGYDDIFDFSEWADIISVSNLGVVSIGLKSDGTVVSTGKIEGASIDVSNWTDIIAVSAGERYIVGLKSDGTVVGQGHDAGDGQLRVNDWTNIVEIATGWRHTVGLDEDGKVFITGYGSNQQLKEIEKKSSDWVNIVSIAAGGGGDYGKGHTVGLRADGTVVVVGDNSYNQCDVGGWRNVIAVAAGDWYTVGLCSDGTVLATRPDSSKGEKYQFASNVDNWNNIVAIAAGCGYTLGLKKDGTVVSTGYNDSRQREGLETWNIAVYDSWINP